MKAALVLGAGLLVNLAIFLGIAKMNASAKAKPAGETWTVREVFMAAPPPRSAPVEEEVPRALVAEPETRPLPTDSTAAAPAPEAYAPRLESIGLDFGTSLSPGGPPVTGLGGSPQGVVGGIPGGVPGGTGTAPALSLSQVDRGPQRAVAPLPPYPLWARTRRLEGVVTLEFTVDETGAVRDMKVASVEGDERFGPVALDAVRAWTYEPGIYGGRKVPVRIIQRVRFTMVDR